MPAITIVPFRPELAPAFARLNRAWIERLFVMEEADRKVLDHPETAIIQPGGQIFFALDGGTPVGTAAAIPVSPLRFELAKMAVDPAYQGRGLGRLLVEAVIDFARSVNAESLFLVTNSSLAGAIRLYERLGFRHAPLPPHNEYARADVYMELVLGVR